MKTFRPLLFLLLSLIAQFVHAQGSMVEAFEAFSKKSLEAKAKTSCPDWKNFYQQLADFGQCKVKDLIGKEHVNCIQPPAPKTPCPAASSGDGAFADSKVLEPPKFSGIGAGEFGTTTYGNMDLGRMGKDRFDSKTANEVDGAITTVNALTGGSIRKNGTGTLIDAGLSIMGGLGAAKADKKEREKQLREQLREQERKEWAETNEVLKNADQFIDQLKEAEAIMNQSTTTQLPKTNPPTVNAENQNATLGSVQTRVSTNQVKTGKATLLIRTDADVVIHLDGERAGLFKAAATIHKLTIESGKYLLGVASSTGAKLQNDTWITVNPGDKELLEFTFGEAQKKIAEQKRLGDEKKAEEEKLQRFFNESITKHLEKLSSQMVPIEGGTFQMGYNRHGAKTTKPVHRVTVSNFEMAAYETTVGDFAFFIFDTNYKTTAEEISYTEFTKMSTVSTEQVTGKSWLFGTDGQPIASAQLAPFPVVFVSWTDAMNYCKWLSKKTGHTYRLPTEAEWEYVARNGKEENLHPWGNNPISTDKVADNFMDLATYKALDNKGAGFKYDWKGAGSDVADSHIYAAPVGSYLPNAYKLYDLGGNVSEWCLDSFDEEFYAKSPSKNPVNTSSTSTDLKKVVRGLSFSDPSFIWQSTTSTLRFGISAIVPSNCIGFRIVRTN